MKPIEKNFKFQDKVIFILSQSKWSKMKVSKHNYAIELAKRGNKVYYFEPPDLSLPQKLAVQNDVEVKGLNVVSYKPVYRGGRFLPEIIYNQLFKLQIRVFEKYLKCTPDVVICFDINRFPNLKWFKAKHTIMFLADLFRNEKMAPVISSADMRLGVTDTIITQLKEHGQNGYFINHGINDAFKKVATKKLIELSASSNKINNRIKVGYMGSLFMQAMDRPIMQKVIEAHPEIDFIFWGQNTRFEDNMVAYEDEQVVEFLDFLKKQPNVVLRGSKNSSDLIDEIQEMDLFWICYDMFRDWLWDGSNSHKLLEYLSTGKPVVAHYVSSYKDTDLLYMLSEKDNSKFPALFDEVIKIIQKGEALDRIKKRLEFALSNTYENQVSFIEDLINNRK